MIDPDKRQVMEAVIRELVDKYAPVLLLNNLIFEIEYDPVEMSDATCGSRFHYPYLNYTFLYGDKFAERYDKGTDLSPYIVHELAHAITDPLYSVALERCATKLQIEAERERLTDHICNIVMISERKTQWIERG